MTIENQEEMIRTCVDLYYNREMSQTEIAKKLFLSRSSVSRLLKMAKEKNYVRILIDDESLSRCFNLERIFKEIFQLENVLIVSDNRMDPLMDQTALATAKYVDTILHNGTIIAISRGKTLKSVVDRMQSDRKLAIKVVQLIGLMNNPEKNDDEMEIAKLFANAYGGDYYNLYSPFIIDDEKVREVFNQYAAVGKTLEMASRASIVLTSIGAYSADDLHIISNSYLSKEEKKELIDKGTVGLICGNYYDIHGNVVETSIKESIIGLPFKEIIKKEVIGVASGKDKAAPILGALRGRFIKTLITDEITALNVLIQNDKEIDMYR